MEAHANLQPSSWDGSMAASGEAANDEEDPVYVEIPVGEDAVEAIESNLVPCFQEKSSNASDNPIHTSFPGKMTSIIRGSLTDTMATFPLTVHGNAAPAGIASISSSQLKKNLASLLPSSPTKSARKSRFFRGASDSADSDLDYKGLTHLKSLYHSRRKQEKSVLKSLCESESTGAHETTSENDEHTRKQTEKMKQIMMMFHEWNEAFSGEEERFHAPVEVRVIDFSYSVILKKDAGKIKTVYNSSFLYHIQRMYKKYSQHGGRNEEQEKKVILDHINLVLQPGKNYLLLGPPKSGKTSLLRAISGHIKQRKSPQNKKSINSSSVMGRILYNGRCMFEDRGRELHIQNAVQYIDQHDRHSPRLTVAETFDFAFQCKAGGTMLRETEWCDDKQLQVLRKYDREHYWVRACLVGLGLDKVSNTFVGDSSIRGVSGGERRRVTVGEMLQQRVSVLCGDEISTGLDAASTYDMVDLLVHRPGYTESTRIISLLQPSPETVSLFDEVIVISEGRIIYAGPILQVEEYFDSLGYKCPEHMDVADFLQQVASPDGDQLYDPSPEMKDRWPIPPSVSDLANRFKESELGKRITGILESPPQFTWKEKKGNKEDDGLHDDGGVSRVAEMMEIKKKYANSTVKNTQLVFRRFMTLWKRDKRVIIAGAAKNILMGVSVGGALNNLVYPVDISGSFFQAGLFIMLSATQNAFSMVGDRSIFYKHYDSNFYSAVPYVVGRTLSTLPQTIFDVVLFGTLLYYIIGLAGRDDAVNFFVYLAVLVAFAFTMQQQLAVFASFSSSSGLQVLSAVTLFFYSLFGGFIVVPDQIPTYYLWAYWINPFAWAFRALILNEFRSDRWDDTDEVLRQLGFVLRDGSLYGDAWIGYSFVYMGLYFVAGIILCAVGLTLSREEVESKTLQIDDKTEPQKKGEPRQVNVPHVPVTLSFHDICYDVKASTGEENLRLLHNVNGVFKPHRMCALMGSSGAGKTTLMDVIAMRKQTGVVSGYIRLNGWPQDQISFRRCSGYVEQFDVQSPELTVRETVLFSARLRLQQEVIEDEEQVQAFIDQVLEAVDLTEIQHALVGTDQGVGLSFAQKKLLSIAVELAASPSIIFLDEPTSGIDSRAALMVVKALRKIADSGDGSNGGRTIIATIHQPSSTVFELFDDLLFLKPGGHVVYHGELGSSSLTMIKYFHSLGAPRIAHGENPANWMLQIMNLDELKDMHERWLLSDEFAGLKQRLSDIYTNQPDPSQKIEYDTEFAAPQQVRQALVTSRLRLIYWRCPAYNLARLTVSAVIAFVLGSVFILERQHTAHREAAMRARFSVIFLAFIITGIMAILSTLPVMTKIRDMYYRHRSSGMYDSLSIGWALGSAEKIFIVLSCVIFVVVFQGTSSMSQHSEESHHKYTGMIGFWGFFTFNYAIYSYFGQAFVCFVKPAATAIILSSVFIGLNNFFSGLIVRPQLMVGGFYAVPYYICPGHYVYEGLVVTLFRRDNGSTVIADEGSDFWDFLNCERGTSDPCEGKVSEYIDFFFGGQFDESNVMRNAIILGFILIITRLSTWLALEYINHA